MRVFLCLTRVALIKPHGFFIARSMEAIIMKQMQVISLPQTGFVRLPVVLSVYPVSKSTWWAGIKSGRFPAGVKLSESTTAWRVEEIRKLIESAGEVASHA